MNYIVAGWFWGVCGKVVSENHGESDGQEDGNKHGNWGAMENQLANE